MKKFFIILFVGIVCFTSGFAQDAFVQTQKLFEAEEILELTFEVDMALLLKDRGLDPPYQRLDFSYTDEQGQELKHRGKIKVRGNFRRSVENCEFPPLRLNVSKKRSAGTVFEGQDKIKIVTHCNDESYVLREYMVYKLCQMISDYAFHVRLARITYVDTQGNQKPMTRFAFFLEDEDLMAQRLGGRLLEAEKILPDQSDEYEVVRLYVFQYMIGNLDWDVYIKKNIRMIELDDNPFPVPVPYDFDWSELVDAPYARYIDSNGKELRKRNFRKLCHAKEIIPDILSEYKAKKQEIYALYENFEYFKRKEVSRVLEYFDPFYELLDDKEEQERIFYEICDE